MDLPVGSLLRHKGSGNLFETIDRPYEYEATCDSDTWWRVKARKVKDGKIHHINLNNYEIERKGR